MSSPDVNISRFGAVLDGSGAVVRAAFTACSAVAVWFVLLRPLRAPTSSRREPPKIFVFGDSLTERGYEEAGWCAALQNLYVGRARVEHAGFGGYNTRYAVSMLGELLGPAPDAPTALLATLWFGANDAALIDKGHGWVHVPLDAYVANLKTLIATLKQHAHHVVVITPPRIDGPGRLAFQVRKYGNSATGELERCNSENKRYAAAAVQVGADSGAHVVDLYSAMESAADWRDMLVDGLHFTPHGQRFVFAQLKQVLDTIPELAADTVPRLFPHVTELQDQ